MADATVTLEVEAGNISSKLIREMAKTERSFMQTVKSAVSKGTSAGVSESGLDKAFTTAIDKAGKHMASAAKLFERAQQTSDMKAKKALLERAELQRKAAESVFDRETKHTKATIDRRWKAHKKAETFLSKSSSERASGVVEAFSKLKGGDAKGFAGAAGGAAQVGTGLLGRGAAAAGAGAAASGGGAAGAGLGAAAASLGAAASGIAAIAAPLAIVAGAFAVLVKLMIDANAQAKEMNKSFLESAGAGDMFFKSSGDGAAELRESLQGLRGAATDFVQNVRWGTVSEDLVKILSTANEAGMTFKEMAADTGTLVNGMKGYLGVTEVALRYSKLLGVDAAELATNIGEWESDLGLGLKQIEESFATVTKVAMESGFGVKRFYSMVQQATSGMALYNVRIEEAARLLEKTGKVLGESEAADFISTLQKGFSQEDYSARLKRVLLTGVEDTRRILGRGADRAADSFISDFGGPLQTALSDMGLEGGQMDLIMSGGEDMAKEIGNMSAGQQRELVARLEKTDAEAARRLSGNLDLFAAKATGSTDDMIDALDNIDMGTKLAMLFDKQIVSDEKTLSEMSALEKQIFAQTQGLDLEMVDKLARMETSLMGQYELAKSGDAATLQMLGLLGDEYTESEKAAAIAKVSEGTFSDFAQDYGWREEELADTISAQESLAQSTVEHTRDMSNILKNGVQFMLEKLYTLMESIWQKYMGLSDVEMAAKRTADEQLTSVLEGASLHLQQMQAAEAEAQRALDTATTTGEQATAAQALSDAQLGTAHAEAGVDLSKRALTELAFVRGGKTDLRTGFEERTQEGFVETAMQRAVDRDGDSASAYLGEEGVSARQDRARSELHDQQFRYQLAAPVLGTMVDMDLPGDLTYGDVAGGLGGVPGMETAVGWDEEFVEDQAVARAVLEDLLATGEKAQTAEDTAALKLQKQAERSDRDRESDIEDGSHAGYLKAIKESELMDAVAGGLQLTGSEQRAYEAGELSPMAMTEILASVRNPLGASNVETPVPDFIFRGGASGGTITPIHRRDQLLGMKQDGAVDQVFGGGTGSMVNITINGGDQAKVYETVKRALRASGVR